MQIKVIYLYWTFILWLTCCWVSCCCCAVVKTLVVVVENGKVGSIRLRSLARATAAACCWAWNCLFRCCIFRWWPCDDDVTGWFVTNCPLPFICPVLIWRIWEKFRPPVNFELSTGCIIDGRVWLCDVIWDDVIRCWTEKLFELGFTKDGFTVDDTWGLKWMFQKTPG